MKKNSKKLLSALLAMVMVLCSLPFVGVTFSASAEDVTDGYYTYTVENGEATITDCDTSISGDVVIPDTLGGYPVTRIGAYAFDWCESLTSINIPGNVTSIGDVAFYGCTGLTSITIPDRVTSIGDSAFYNCESLLNITIPDSVTSIGEYAFGNCTSLTSITISDSVTRIGKGAFYNTDYYNNNSNWENGVLYIGKHLIKAKSSVSGVYNIKDETKSIADYTFWDCDNLTSIAIPESVVSIGYKALGYYYSHSVANDERIYNFTVTGYRNTAAETYANENGFAFIALDEEHTHTFGEQIIGQPTCTKSGEKIFTCTQCAYSYTEVIPATGHTDNDNDGNCDSCGEKVGEPVNPPEPTNPSENCSCACHKGGIAKLFFKIGLFFQKLFKKNQVCKCGAWHY